MKSKYFLILPLITSLCIFSSVAQNEIKKEYFDSGKLQSETPFTDGKENGIQKWYYENGNLSYETTYTNGKINGIEKVYSTSGKLEYENTYIDSQKNGIQKGYYEDGQLKSETNYVNNNVVGKAKLYAQVKAEKDYVVTVKNDTVYNQMANIKWAEPIFGNKKIGNFSEIAGENSRYVYITVTKEYRSTIEKMIKIVKYDKVLMKEISNRVVYDVKDTAYDFVHSTYYQTIVYENKIYVVWGKDNGHGERDFYITSYDSNLNPLKKLTKVYSGSTTGDVKDSRYKRFAVNYNILDGSLLITKRTNLKGEEVELDYQYLDSNLTVISNNQVKLPLVTNGRSSIFSDMTWELGTDGNLHLKYTANLSKEESSKLKKNENELQPMYSIINLKRGAIETFPFKFDDKNIFDFNYVADKNSVKIVGFFCDLTKDPKGKKTHGFFYATVNPQTLKVLTDFKFNYFTKEQLTVFEKDFFLFSNKEKQSKDESVSSEYKIEKAKSVDDNIVLFCSKSRNYTVNSSYTNSSGMTSNSSIKYCDKEGVTALKINKDAEIVWAKSIEREQTFVGTSVKDLEVIYKNNKFVVFYSQRGIKDFPYAVFDYKTGEYEKKLLIKNEDDTYRKKMKSSYWKVFGNGYYFYTRIYLSGWIHSKLCTNFGRVTVN